MPVFRDLIGHVFGRLTVIGRDQTSCYMTWICQCVCGNIKSIRACHLVTGGAESCGCIRKELLVAKNTTHGQSRTAEYNTWLMMKNRCMNPNTIQYNDYGGRGIKICDRWINSFENFYADMGPKPSSEHSIDRFPDNNGNYEPSNCRWATKFEQAQNKRNNRWIQNEAGVTTPIAQAARNTGINEATLRFRLNRGMSDVEALNKPTEVLYFYNGCTFSLADWSSLYGIPRKTLYRRIHEQKWSIERALITPIP